MPWLVYQRFEKVSISYQEWARDFLSAENQNFDTVDCSPVTEWPVFGSAFYLLTAEEIVKQLDGKNDEKSVRIKNIAKDTSALAAKVLIDPKTGTWSRNIWGENYRDENNVFYRMLIIMGLASYEKTTDDDTYRSILRKQTVSLAEELSRSQTNLAQDYPGECYPSDVLWAVAAIRRADTILGTNYLGLQKDLMENLNKLTLTDEGLPAYAVCVDSGLPLSPARGCANSGILIFAPELNSALAQDWYNNYEDNFFKGGLFCIGFREFSRDYPCPVADMDSGLIYRGYGSVATAFAIGAARANGRLDHSVPLTMEMVAVSWPTPFGFLVPKLLSYANCRISCMGEISLLFLMSRPIVNNQVRIYEGHMPLLVTLLCVFYLSGGLIIIIAEFSFWYNWRKRNPK
jgi:hypothetical protein